MVETVWAESIAEATTPPPTEKRPSLRPDRPLALVSPTVGRRMKGQRGVNGKYTPLKLSYPKVSMLNFNCSLVLDSHFLFLSLQFSKV